MAEYIEREAAIKMIENDLPEQVRYYKQDAIDCLQCMPTADVVPKSEVVNILDILIKEAGEIAESYKVRIAELNGLEYADRVKSEYIGTQVGALLVQLRIAQLKKKYMGSVIVGEWKFDEKINTEQPDLSNVKFIDKDGNITNRDDALDWNEAPPLEESEDKG